MGIYCYQVAHMQKTSSVIQDTVQWHMMRIIHLSNYLIKLWNQQ